MYHIIAYGRNRGATGTFWYITVAYKANSEEEAKNLFLVDYELHHWEKIVYLP